MFWRSFDKTDGKALLICKEKEGVVKEMRMDRGPARKKKKQNQFTHMGANDVHQLRGPLARPRQCVVYSGTNTVQRRANSSRDWPGGSPNRPSGGRLCTSGWLSGAPKFKCRPITGRAARDFSSPSGLLTKNLRCSERAVVTKRTP